MMDTQYYRDWMYDVVGALFNVQNGLGLGLNEYCYQEALAIELKKQHIPHEKEVTLHPMYDGKQLSSVVRADFICKDNIIVECKAVIELIPIHRAQLFSYMRIAQAPCGILVNFGQVGKLSMERYLYDIETDKIYTIDGREFIYSLNC